MGYLIRAHLTKKRPDEATLRSLLPPSMGFTIFYNESACVYGIDLFDLTKPPAFPFTHLVPSRDLPLDLGAHLSSVAVAYEVARLEGFANGIKRAYINLAERLSAGLEQDVLSICADDDGLDFACIAEAGKAVSLIAACGDRVLVYTKGVEPEFKLADDTHFHANASSLFERYAEAPSESVGLGSWDSPVDYGFRLTLKTPGVLDY